MVRLLGLASGLFLNNSIKVEISLSASWAAFISAGVMTVKGDLAKRSFEVSLGWFPLFDVCFRFMARMDESDGDDVSPMEFEAGSSRGAVWSPSLKEVMFSFLVVFSLLREVMCSTVVPSLSPSLKEVKSSLLNRLAMSGSTSAGSVAGRPWAIFNGKHSWQDDRLQGLEARRLRLSAFWCVFPGL